ACAARQDRRHGIHSRDGLKVPYCPAAVVSTAHAIRSPLLPLGSVFSSSGLAWITRAVPSASAKSPSIANLALAFPSVPTIRLDRSPRCAPNGFWCPCCLPVGF